MPLSSLIESIASTAGADSAVRAYKTLRARYYGADAHSTKYSPFVTESPRSAPV